MALDKTTRNVILAFLTDNKIHYERGWKNYMGTVKAPNAILVQVDSEQDVCKLLAHIHTLNQDRDSTITIRAAAGHTDTTTFNLCRLFKRHHKKKYDESFSFSGNIPADIIIRFGKKFHKISIGETVTHNGLINPDNPITQLPRTAVTVSAGVQIAELVDKLRKEKLSVTSVSMIPWVTAVGLQATDGHGTGKDEPSFSGHVIAMRICKEDGEIREIKEGDLLFETIRSAHNGFFGIVLNITLKAVPAFNLEERIVNSTSIQTLAPELQGLLNSPYFTLMHIPVYTETTSVNAWHVRLWRKSDAKITRHEKPPYYPDGSVLTEEISVKIGASVQALLLEADLAHLIPTYMAIAATVVTEERGTKTTVLPEHHMTHYRVAFPKDMRDTSWMFAVEHEQAGEVLGHVLSKINALLISAKDRGEYPVTYAVYVRYFKGTNDGISTSHTTTATERTFSIDFVTHPNAPGIKAFERELLAYFKTQNIKLKFHFGKNLPDGVTQYCDFIDKEALEQFREDLLLWHAIDDIEHCPFVSPQSLELLEPHKRQTEVAQPPTPRPQSTMPIDDCITALQSLQAAVSNMNIPTNQAELKSRFITQLEDAISHKAQQMFMQPA